MSKYKIAVIVGSVRNDSFNRRLADAIIKLAPTEFTFKQVQINDLPLYNQDDDVHPAASVKRLKQEIMEADGLLFVTPEYNRSIPGVLKNAIDHASRPFGEVSGRESRPVFWVFRSVLSEQPWLSSICAIFSLFWMYQRWHNLKRSFRQKKDFLI